MVERRRRFRRSSPCRRSCRAARAPAPIVAPSQRMARSMRALRRDADAVADHARTDDRRARRRRARRADPHVAVDSRALAQRCRWGRHRSRAYRESKRRRDDVVARAPVLARRADVAPIRAARVESVERLAGRLQRGKHLLAEIVELVRREYARRSPARRRRCRCSPSWLRSVPFAGFS